MISQALLHDYHIHIVFRNCSQLACNWKASVHRRWPQHTQQNFCASPRHAFIQVGVPQFGTNRFEERRLINGRLSEASLLAKAATFADNVLIRS